MRDNRCFPVFREIAEFKDRVGKFCNIKNTLNKKLFKSILGNTVVARLFTILKFLNTIMKDKCLNFRMGNRGRLRKVIYCIIDMIEVGWTSEEEIWRE